MSILFSLLTAVLAFLLGAAHFWRIGQYGISVACMLFPLFFLQMRGDWLRRISHILLVALAGCWMWTAGEFVQIRQFLGQPWHRLAFILAGTALFTLLAATLMNSESIRRRNSLQAAVSDLQLMAFFMVLFIFGGIWATRPGLLLLERLLPGFGALQCLLAALWAGWVCGALADQSRAAAFRMRIWKIFSLTFFIQLFLGIAVHGLFLLSGRLHIPVPGVIPAAWFYGQGSVFMLILYGISILLLGGAWCSHLCYFGVWDSLAAGRKPPISGRRMPRSLPQLRWLALMAVIAIPIFLRLANFSIHVAVWSGLMLGLLMLPMSLLVSRRFGVVGYCAGICPLGLLANILSKFSPWRIRREERKCTSCRACIRVCRHGALTENHLVRNAPGFGCTLCRDCLHVCHHDALHLTFFGLLCTRRAATTAFVVLVSIAHTLFLWIARV